jgi:hypothetical protein
MAVYKIFPEKDATLYSQYPYSNTGLDEILEISTIIDDQAVYASRPVIQFNQTEIADLISNKISGSAWQSNLRLFLAYASNIPLNYNIYAYPISGSWNMGTGHYQDSPINDTGVSWRFQLESGSGGWPISSFSPYVTASFPTLQPGGGAWYTGSTTLNPVSSQSFTYATSKDINLNVTNTVNLFVSGTISNNGFILKKDDSLEFNSESAFELKYFSVDTHTIYPPCLEFKWNDFSTVLTGSLVSSILSTSDFKLSLPNNPGYFYVGSIAKVRVNARPTNPPKIWQTASLFTINYALPQTTYYAIKDLDTDEFVIDFDSNYTKVSCDSTGNYFTLYMNGLEPERYYKILIRSTIGATTTVFDNDYIFKVVNG